MSTHRNPENPFIKNEYYYPDAIPYEQTMSYLIHKISNISAFVIGIFLVGLLLFMIAFKTPSHFRAYSKMVIICVVTDLIIILLDFLCQTRVRIAEGVFMLSFTGPFSYPSYKLQCSLMILQAFCAVLAPAILPLQYFYRYRTIKERKPPTILQTFLSYCVSLSFASFFAILSIPAYSMDPSELPDFDYAQLWFEEAPIPIIVLGTIQSPWMVAKMIYLSTFVPACYLLSIWLARRTIKELAVQQYELTEKTKNLQKQFTKTLFVQAVTPLFSSVLPLSIVVIEMVLGSSSKFSGEFVIMGITFFPILNCLSNIIFIVPYRRFVLNLVPGYTKKSSMVYPSVSVVRQTHPSSIKVCNSRNS